MSDNKTLTSEQHLQALALFTMAAHHACEAEKFRQGLRRLLGATSLLGHIDDAIYDDRHQNPHSLADALKAEGYTIEEEAKHTEKAG